MATATRSAANQIVHANFSVTASPVTKAVSVKAVYVTISNRGTAEGDSVGVSFDGGVTYFDINPSESFAFDIWGITSYMIKSNAGTINVQCLYGIEG